MPLTPFHLGPALLFGLILFRYVNLPSFLAANVIVDLEPFFVLVLGLDYPLHGFFHSFLGGSLVALVLFFVMVKVNPRIQEVMGYFGLRQDGSVRSIGIACFFGVYFHILLDCFLYTDIMPFYPLDANPVYGLFSGSEVYMFCIMSFVLGGVIYGWRLLKKKF